MNRLQGRIYRLEYRTLEIAVPSPEGMEPPAHIHGKRQEDGQIVVLADNLEQAIQGLHAAWLGSGEPELDTEDGAWWLRSNLLVTTAEELTSERVNLIALPRSAKGGAA
jgi:hypothetical protein